MPTETDKRTVEQIVEANIGGVEFEALDIYEIQNRAECYVDKWRGSMAGEIDWGLVDHQGIPREFVELCDKIARLEIRL